jgi:predicted TIM-barrel fold metal-dependent hydrolase
MTGPEGGEVEVSIVDCDVHGPVSTRGAAGRAHGALSAIDDAMLDYLPEPWRTRHYRHAIEAAEMNAPILTMPTQPFRADAEIPSGWSEVDWMEKQLFEEAGVDFAMLLFLRPGPKPHNEEWESALYRAHNDWLADSWLSKNNSHGRYRGAIRVCISDPDAAVDEIYRWAGHPFVSQIYITLESSVPYGHPRFRKVLAASAATGLPIALHPVRAPGMRVLTPVGFPSTHMESFSQWPLSLMSHLASMIFEGVFEDLPDLRVVAVEEGFSWLPPFMWRLDNHWAALGLRDGGCKRPPSEYLRESLRLTTQPLDEPEPRQNLNQVMQWLPADRMLLFATDYPHYDFDDPAWVSVRLPAASKAKIMFENALDLYKLPRTRPRDRFDLARERAEVHS